MTPDTPDYLKQAYADGYNRGIHEARPTSRDTRGKRPRRALFFMLGAFISALLFGTASFEVGRREGARATDAYAEEAARLDLARAEKELAEALERVQELEGRTGLKSRSSTGGREASRSEAKSDWPSHGLRKPWVHAVLTAGSFEGKWPFTSDRAVIAVERRPNGAIIALVDGQWYPVNGTASGRHRAIGCAPSTEPVWRIDEELMAQVAEESGGGLDVPVVRISIGDIIGYAERLARREGR